MEHSHSHSQDDAHCRCSGWVAAQSLQEMEFARRLPGAAHAGDLGRMRQLLEKGCCVHGGPGESYTPLHYAARNGHVDACRLLLQHGARVDARTGAGSATSLHRAAYAGHQAVVELLLAAGADAGAVDADGRTPMDRAAAAGHRGIVDRLRRCQAENG